MISIIIPAYNAQKYIERSVNSCLKQDYLDIEIIIVDDGSKDETLNISRKLQKENSKIRILEKQNSGVSAARNLGIQFAKGEYILFLDADDYLEFDFCSKMISRMEPDIDLVVCGYKKEEKTGVIKNEYPNSTKIYCREEKYDLLKALKKSNCLFTCWNKLFRKQCIKQYFNCNMSFAEDSVFVIDYIKECNKVQVFPYSGYHYWIGTENSAMKKYHKNMLDMIEYEFKELINLDITSPEIYVFASEHFVENLFYCCIPQLLSDKSITFQIKVKILKNIYNFSHIESILNNFPARRRKHKIYNYMLKKRTLKIFIFLFWFDMKLSSRRE